MVSGKGSTLAATLRPCYDHARLLRGRIECSTIGKTNLTDEQIADLVLAEFPQIYAPADRKTLIEEVAKITPLGCRGGDATGDPTPVAKKQRIDEAGNASALNEFEVAGSERGSSSRSTYHNSDTSSDTRDLDFSESVGFGGYRIERYGDDDEGWRIGGGKNSPRFKDLHGSEAHDIMVEELKREVIVPLLQLNLLRHFGVQPTARILLHGPLSCGKTSLAHAIANEACVPFYEVSAADLVSGALGSPEENIRELFKKAFGKAPCIVFIDEIDAMNSKTKGLQKVIKPSVVKQLMACMDERQGIIEPVDEDAISGIYTNTSNHVLVIGATNKIDAVDPALRRWFDREYVITAPDEKARLRILKALTRNLKVEEGLDLAKIARCTLGFVAGNLVELVKEAGNVAADRVMDGRILQSCKAERGTIRITHYYKQLYSDKELGNLTITMEDFMEAGKMIYASADIEDFSTTPNAKWDDVVGLQLLKSEFERHIIKRLEFPEVYKAIALEKDDYGHPKKLPPPRTKFFLYGPPGSGKTFIVEALAHKTGAKFIHVKAEKLSKYGAQSGWVVQNLLHYAKTCAPCIVFFDELEKVRRAGEVERKWPDFRKLITALGDVDEDLSGVYIFGAANVIGVGKHLHLIRTQFDKIFHLPLPTPEERGAILKVLARGKPIDGEVDLMAVGKRDRLLDEGCWHYNGHDLSRLMSGAGKAAVNRSGGCTGPWTIKLEDFKMSFEHDAMINSITRSERKKYERYYCEYREAIRDKRRA